MSISSTDIDRIVGTTVRGPHNGPLGSVGQVFVDADGTPVWVSVRTGVVDGPESVVPLVGAELDGESLLIGFDEDTVENAPRIDPGSELDDEATQLLYHYFRRASQAREPGRLHDEQPEYDPYDHVESLEPARRAHGVSTPDGLPTGQGTSDPETGDAWSPPEGGLTAGSTPPVSTHAKLHKHAVTTPQEATEGLRKDEIEINGGLGDDS